ncbi:MAG: hypothetical protein ACLQAH_14590 [Limisphaerales bacterium]
MTDTIVGRTAWMRAFVFLIVFLTVSGWGLSWLHKLDWQEWLCLAGILATVAVARREAGSWNNLWASAGEPLAFWPFILVALLALVAAVAYPPTMLDALTYRLPRILLWWQDNHVRHIQTADPRLNYMPQGWGLITLPLIQLAGDRLVAFWNYASLVIFYFVAFDWALEISGSLSKSRAMAFIASTSTFAVLQACEAANDLFLATLILLGLRFVMQFERTRDWREIPSAVLCLLLAADAKPHVIVLVLPLGIWFWMSPSTPWKAFRWRWLPAFIPLWLICSPVLSWILNYETYQNWSGKGMNSSFSGSPVWNVLLGTVMMLWQGIQPPVNPLALALNGWLEPIISHLGVLNLVPRFNLRSSPVAMVDRASPGLVLFVLLVAGVVLSIRRARRELYSWRGWTMITGVAGYCLALSYFVPEAVGRSYSVFLLFSVPLAMVGWNLMRPQVLRISLYLCLASSLLSLVLNPERPLWPANRVHQALAAAPRFKRLAKVMDPYLLMPERARTGEALVQAIPGDEPAVVVLVGDDRPLLAFFRPYSLGRDVLLLAPHANQGELNRRQVNYVIMGGGVEEQYPELCRYVEQSGDYELVLSHDYTSKLTRGVETWKLFRRKVLLPVSAYKPE